MKITGSLGWQVPTNDSLGRFAFLDKLPSDILATLAPVASPIFTGTVTVPTPAVGSNTTVAASTAFVNALKNGLVSIDVSAGGGFVLAATQYGVGVIILVGSPSAAISLVLPSQTGTWVISNQLTTNYNVTVTAASAAASSKTALIVQNQSSTVLSDGTNVNAAGNATAQAFNVYPFTATAGQTSFPFTYTPGNVIGYYNNLPIAPSAMNTTSGSAVVMNAAANANDQYLFFAFTSIQVTNALPKSGGVLTGPVTFAGGDTAVTLAATDTSRGLATMAALHAVANTYSGYTASAAANATTTLTSAQLGSYTTVSAAAGTTLLPASSAMTGLTGWLGVTNVSAGVQTVSPQGSDVLVNATSGTTMILNPGETALFFYNGSTSWIVIEGNGIPMGRLLNIRVFSTPGTSTYTPTPGTKSVVAHLVGAGGGSGGIPATSSTTYGVVAPGDVGSYAIARYTSGFSGAILTVGAAGVAGTSSGNGGQGGTTSFGSLTTVPGGPGSPLGTASASAVTSASGGGSSAPTGSNILVSAYGIPTHQAYSSGTGIFLNIRPHVGPFAGSNAGMGGAGLSLAPSASAVAGNVGTAGLIYLLEYS